VIAYAGIPLVDSDGNALGTLCTIDDHPRVWTRHQVALLKDIADSVLREIELTRVSSN
jgi:GAF domain-containing protein